jgi:hypothetical protein
VSTGQNEQSRTVYPSFYGAVHRAWNALCDQYIVAVDAMVPEARSGTARLPRCEGAEAPYDPDEHPFCVDLAQLLRVELHAAGIMLSNDGNGSEPEPVIAEHMAQIMVLAGVPCHRCGARTGEYHGTTCPNAQIRFVDGRMNRAKGAI